MDSTDGGLLGLEVNTPNVYSPIQSICGANAVACGSIGGWLINCWAANLIGGAIALNGALK